MDTGSNNSSTFEFADVLLPLPLPKPYTYLVPEKFTGTLSEGLRVLVQFGKKRILTGIIKKIHTNRPEVYEAKEILEVLDDEPILTKPQSDLIDWIADYYMCTSGEVLNAAIPSGLKLTSESKIQLNPDFDHSKGIPFSEQELKIIDIVSAHSAVTFHELPKLSGIRVPTVFIRSLLEKKRILLFEEVKEKYTPKKIKKIRLTSHYLSSEKLKDLFEKIKNKRAQTDLLLKVLSITPIAKSELLEKGITKSYLQESCSETALRSLIKSGVLEEFSEIIPRFKIENNDSEYKLQLSPSQQKARDSILKIFEEKDTVLLHGLTGSGKTEIYIDIISKVSESGGQVLYLLPEIALTTQIVSRLKKAFGSKLAVFHSKFSDNERVDVYRGLITGQYSIIIGVRSSIFLPFDNLDLIIIDEEHETSYKQQEPSPRYNARDTALMLARLHNAKTLLGSATPSIETYYQSIEGRWGLVELFERYADAKLPDIILTNIRTEKKMKRMKGEFSELLLQELGNVVEKKEQAILFQNRRGYAPYLSCEDCAYVFSCKNCDVSLTYHLHSSQLRCHYCGESIPPPPSCPACGSSKLLTSGFGTEKLEDDLKIFLPEVKVTRMDLDTTRKKNSFQEIITDFEEGKTDILVGTQMVTKGLDFNKVTLVGIFDSDRLIYFPDFRSYERAFQVLLQVSGRAGRKDKPGKVILQTSNPDHKVFQYVLNHDYTTFFQDEIQERKKFMYPPFSRMIKLIIRNADRIIAQKTADDLGKMLIKNLGVERVLGPEAPVINKIRNYYIFHIFIKLEKEKTSPSKAKQVINFTINSILNKPEFRSSQIIPDVDPL